MRRIFKFSISISLLLCSLLLNAQEADTIEARKSISAGFDITGPVLYALDKTKYNYEGHLSYRLNYKYYIVCEPGYSSYSYKQYNYEYNSEGWFVRIGTDIGMLEPVASKINHFAGIGLRYCLSVFEQETPSISTENYWGKVNTSIPRNSVHAHFLEIQGGVKTELVRNLLIGWSVKLRTLIYSSGKNEKKAVYIPGMGTTGASFIPSVSYYIIYRIPFGSSSGV
ncbi:MAG: hypothetical protein JW965_02440 [Bacteroidales bacterium]|nr:hypothetical protein [Bacteroidales bacterium]